MVESLGYQLCTEKTKEQISNGYMSTNIILLPKNDRGQKYVELELSFKNPGNEIFSFPNSKIS